jgi:hypothetical protein
VLFEGDGYEVVEDDEDLQGPPPEEESDDDDEKDVNRAADGLSDMVRGPR